MAFDGAELKASLKPIRGERKAHFLFTDRDSDQQPFLKISRGPVKGREVAEKRKEAQGKVYIGRVRLDPKEDVYVFSSKQSIPEGRFSKAIKLIAKTVRALAGARLEKFIEGEDEGEDVAVDTTPTKDKIGLDTSMLPIELRMDSAFAKQVDQASRQEWELRQSKQGLRETEKQTSKGAQDVLALEDALEKHLLSSPRYTEQVAVLTQRTKIAEQAVDAYIDAADKLDLLNEQLTALQQGREILSINLTISKLERDLKKEGADTKGLTAQIEKLRSQQQSLRESQERDIQELTKQIQSQTEEVGRLELLAQSANTDLDKAEETLNQTREELLSEDRAGALIQISLVEASKKLDRLVNIENEAALEVQKKQATLNESRRQLQAAADNARGKEFLDRVDSQFTEKNTAALSLSARMKAKDQLTGKLLGSLQEHSVDTVAERLAQMGSTVTEYMSSLRDTDPTPGKTIPTGPGPKKVEATSAQETMKGYLGSLSEEQKTALSSFGKYGCDWKKVKAESATSKDAMETMKVVREVRNQFMDDALRQTSALLMDNLKSQLSEALGTDQKLRQALMELEPVELDPRDPKADPVYADGRKRRYQLRFPEGPLREKFGETLTLQYFAPGSTNPTSDIDMQFICEENPTACTGMIETFRQVCQERLQGVEKAMNEVLGDKLGSTPLKLGTLAQTFDTNPYPAGFVNRPEQSVGQHFSDTFTQRSMEEKKIADVGLAMIRNLESPLDPKQDPVEQILQEADALKDPSASLKARRALAVGVGISLCSQLDQATALVAQKGWTEELGTLKGELEAALKEISTTHGRPDVGGAWQKAPPTDEQLKAMQAAARRLQGILHEINSHGGDSLVSEARYAAFLESQKQVERMTRARDLALSEGAERVSQYEECVELSTRFEQAEALLGTEGLPSGDARTALEKAVEAARKTNDQLRGSLLALPPDIVTHTKALGAAILDMRKAAKRANVTLTKPEPGKKTLALQRARDEELESVRSATSALGVSAFLLQGMALNNADEAYTSRGAIGLVVEKDQIGRQVIATTGTAISSLESNAGFFHEHVREERAHGIDVDAPVTDNLVGQKKLTEFCVGIAKYIERIGKAFQESDPDDLRESLPGVDLSWLVPLTQGLLALKDGRNPDTNQSIAENTGGPSIETVCTTFLGRFEIRSIGDLQKKMMLIEKQARQTLWAQEATGSKPPSRPLSEEIEKSFQTKKEDWDDV